MDFRIIAAGLLVGFLIGLTGMGGGALMAPLLIFVFGVRPILAVGTDLAYSAITKIFGAWQHYRQETVDLRVVLYLALGGLPAGLLGVATTSFVKRSYGTYVDVLIIKFLGATLVLVSAFLFVRSIAKTDGNSLPNDVEIVALKGWQRVLTIAWGAVVGFLVGMTSVGSGSLIVPFLALIYPLSASKIVGTDIFQAAMLVSVLGLAHFSVGNVNLPLAGNLLIGSIPGIYLGSRLSKRSPDRVLRIVLAMVLFVTGLRMI